LGQFDARPAVRGGEDIEVGGPSDATRAAIAGAVKRVEETTARAILTLKTRGD